MNEFSLEALLGLYSVQGIGPTRMRKLISKFESPQAVLNANLTQLTKIEGFDQKIAEKILEGPDEQFVENQLELLDKYHTKLITYWDAQYPARLKKIYDPPVFLFYKGNTGCLNNAVMAVVGTRKPSSYGRMITEKFTAELVRRGLAISSGLARGIDTIANKTTLKNAGTAIAVLGNGLDQIYPPENRELYQEIIEKGIIISEYPMATLPDAMNFPKRNRIISGLSLGVLVCEAGDKSGALLTALYANDQNREVFAIPGSIVSEKSAGTNKLIRNGAKLTSCVQDILDELKGQTNLDFSEKTEKTAEPELKGPSKKIYKILNMDPIHIDKLAFDAGMATAEVLSILLILELKGFIRQLAGKMFIRN